MKLMNTRLSIASLFLLACSAFAQAASGELVNCTLSRSRENGSGQANARALFYDLSVAPGTYGTLGIEFTLQSTQGGVAIKISNGANCTSSIASTKSVETCTLSSNEFGDLRVSVACEPTTLSQAPTTGCRSDEQPYHLSIRELTADQYLTRGQVAPGAPRTALTIDGCVRNVLTYTDWAFAVRDYSLQRISGTATLSELDEQGLPTANVKVKTITGLYEGNHIATHGWTYTFTEANSNPLLLQTNTIYSDDYRFTIDGIVRIGR